MGPQHHRSISRISASVLVALATLLGALVVGASAPAAADVSDEATFTSRLNDERTSRGLAPLTVRSDLVAVAREQAARMAASSTLAHNPNLTSDVQDWRWVGENVGYGPDALTVHAAFMGSPGHKANILDTDYTEVGIGTVTAGSRVWVAQVFRRPAQSATTTSTTTSTTTRPTTVTSASRSTVAVATYTHKLVVGSTGADVKRVQARLGLKATGTYAQATAAAVRDYQLRQGWKGSGNVGLRTWNRLF